jgi:hypothetical protein
LTVGRTFVCVLVLLVVCGAAAGVARAGQGPQVVARVAVGAGRVVVVRGEVAAPQRTARVVLQRRRRGHWVAVTRRARVTLDGRFVVRWKATPGAKVVVLRVGLAARGHIVARSRALSVHIARSGSTAFNVPPTTRLYGAKAIASVARGTIGSGATVTLAAGSRRPVVGGHVAIAPVAGLPDGMFATVVAAHLEHGRWVLALERASVDQVLDDVSIDVDKNVVPKLVDADGRAVPSSDRGPFTIRGTGAFGAPRAASFGSVFTCKESGGIARKADDLWTTGLPFPISIKLDHTHVTHRFYAGSVFPRADPYLLLQLSGEAVGSVGFQGKTGFKCELADRYRADHRFQIQIGTIVGIPVAAYLEPTFEFEVSAAGKVELSQRHYFAITLEKDGFKPLHVRLAHSTDPVKVTPSAVLSASIFAGGDLSLMLGGGYKSASAAAGVYGAFGPEFDLKASTAKPGCLSLTGKLEADFGVRLQLLVKRWNLEVASLSTRDADLGGPWCVTSGGAGAGGGGGGGRGGGWGGPQPSPSGPWRLTAPQIAPDRAELIDVSCPSTSLCVAVGKNLTFPAANELGVIATSTNPTGGVGAWHVARWPTGVVAVSCPSTTLCVAVDNTGHVLTSTNPTGGAGAWTATQLTIFTPGARISCPSALLCVGVDGGGAVFTSTNPTGGTSAWSVTSIANVLPGDVSCPTTTLCAIAAPSSGGILTSTNPAGGASAWTLRAVNPAPQLISCSSPTRCLGAILTTHAPPYTVIAMSLSGGVVTGQTATDLSPIAPPVLVPQASGFADVACPTQAFCVIAATAQTNGPTDAAAFASTDPAGGAGAWHATMATGASQIGQASAIACPSTSLCVMVDDFANIITSTTPAA